MVNIFGHKDDNEFQGTEWSIFLKVSNLRVMRYLHTAEKKTNN